MTQKSFNESEGIQIHQTRVVSHWLFGNSQDYQEDDEIFILFSLKSFCTLRLTLLLFFKFKNHKAYLLEICILSISLSSIILI